MSFLDDATTGETSDEILIRESLTGNKDSLEWLIKRHQDYIYNISLKLFLDPEDALDATQEVLIKVITSLKTFRGESRFRTWLYRIAFNHFLNSPLRKMEKMLTRGFSLDTMEAVPAESEVSDAEIEEVRIACLTGMLMCLSREQRLIYIVGDVFETDHNLGAELFETTPANFRVKLHRARADLLNYVQGKCGLINPNNSCRCHKKANVMIANGLVDKNNLRFNTDYQLKINQIVRRKNLELCGEVQTKMLELYQDSPFQTRDELDKFFARFTLDPNS